jgi:hypothetical protein
MSFVLHRNLRQRRPRKLSVAIALAAMASPAWAAVSPVTSDRNGPPRTPRQSDPETPAAEIAAREIADGEPAHPWSPEPHWLRKPMIDLHVQPQPEAPPAPIPLPPAVMVGPVFVTAMLAGAALQRRRRGTAWRR